MRLRLRSIALLLLLLVGYAETHADTVRSAANVAAATQDYPAMLVRIIDPFGAGGGPYLLARTLAPKLSELWGQPVTVDSAEKAYLQNVMLKVCRVVLYDRWHR